MTTETLDEARERLRPYVERARGFTGWVDFPVPRPLGADKPWSYSDRARELLHSATAVLDLGTGGGERFGSLLEGFRGRVVATEPWVVNAPIAARALRPFSGSVAGCSSLQLPFVDSAFDLVLSRHEEISPSEVGRILRPEGAFLTQQTWRYVEEVAYYIPRFADFGDHFHGYQAGLARAGLRLVDAREHVVPCAFRGLEDLVYLLCVTPWHVPNFDPLGRDLVSLLALERDLTTAEGLVLTCGHYIIEAHKPS